MEPHLSPAAELESGIAPAGVWFAAGKGVANVFTVAGVATDGCNVLKDFFRPCANYFGQTQMCW